MGAGIKFVDSPEKSVNIFLDRTILGRMGEISLDLVFIDNYARRAPFDQKIRYCINSRRICVEREL